MLYIAWVRVSFPREGGRSTHRLSALTSGNKARLLLNPHFNFQVFFLCYINPNKSDTLSLSLLFPQEITQERKNPQKQQLLRLKCAAKAGKNKVKIALRRFKEEYPQLLRCFLTPQRLWKVFIARVLLFSGFAPGTTIVTSL